VSKRFDDYTLREVAGAVFDVVAEVTPQVKAEHEFTTPDFQAAVLRERGVALNRRQAEYRLNCLVQEGKLGKAVRLDPRTGRTVKCYWKLLAGEEDA